LLVKYTRRDSNQKPQPSTVTKDSVNGQLQALQNPMHEKLVLVFELLLQLPQPLKQVIIEMLGSNGD